MDKLLVLNFLIAIQGIETDHGKLMNHPVVTNSNSVNYGAIALSKYGMMPNTIKMYSRSPAAIDRFEHDYNYQFKIAYRHAFKTLVAANGNACKASILWEKGPGGRITQSDYQKPRYRRFKKEFGLLNGSCR